MITAFSLGCSNCWKGCNFSVTSLDTPAALMLWVAISLAFGLLSYPYTYERIRVPGCHRYKSYRTAPGRNQSTFQKQTPYGIRPVRYSWLSRQASMGIVPEPHIGSIRSHSPCQPLINIMPAAKTSFRGASTAS